MQNSAKNSQLTDITEVISKDNLDLSQNFIEDITSFLSALKLETGKDYRSEINYTNEKLYLEFNDFTKQLPQNILEKTFHTIFGMNSQPPATMCQETPYKLLVGKDGIKMEIIAERNTIKLFRLISALNN